MRSATESAAKDPTPKEEDSPVLPVIQHEQQVLPIQTSPDPIEPAAEQLEAAPADEKFTRLPLRLIGIVFDTYIIRNIRIACCCAINTLCTSGCSMSA